MELESVDVAVVGGGLAGSAMVAVLARHGFRTVLVDPNPVVQPDFRGEKLTRLQMDVLARLQIDDSVRSVATTIPDVSIARRGRVVESRRICEYGVNYADLVNAIRQKIPRECFYAGTVSHLDLSSTFQRVRFRSGESLAARLVIVATGLGRKLLRDLGMRHVESGCGPTLAIGFDLHQTSGAQPWSSLTYYGETTADRLAYLTIFPIQDRLRANLFVFRPLNDAWTDRFCADPEGCLDGTLPGLRTVLPPYMISSSPVVRPIVLHQTTDYLRDGLVVIGDAFATSCPAGGTGLGKALNDVDCLARLVPRWLTTDGMDIGKTAAFYVDPVKRQSDRVARHATVYARAIATNEGPMWAARRFRNYHAASLRGFLQDRLGLFA